ncbi:MAG: heme o synthase [Deltaproteobacteria bacterium]|nr:heme o synthase [Deltaproteobacteria bacterium]
MSSFDASSLTAAGLSGVPRSITPSSLKQTVRDCIALGKPNIAFMAAIVAGGTWLLSAPVVDMTTLVRGFFGVCGVAFIVMGAGALNMLIERDVDALMTRTKDRPLAAGRMAPTTALVIGALWCLLSLPLLLSFGNALTAGLALFSLFLYVLVYTPMKRTSPWSLVVGAVPGAMPALMGGTLATGQVGVAGVAMFTIVFIWQLPHFLAISLYREPEYVRAGHKLFPTVLGLEATKVLIAVTTVLVCALSVALWPLGLGGVAYAVVAVAVGLWFSATALSRFRVRKSGRADDDVWAKRVFIGSLVWQTVVFGALGVDRSLVLLAS